MMLKYLTTILLLFSNSSCVAQNKLTDHVYRLGDGKSELATIEDFSLLVGDWTGEGMGGKCDELWMPSRAGQMHGVFRMSADDKLVFTEFMTIMEDSLSYVMKIKHFSPDFDGWEEKDETVDFRFIRKDNFTLYFSGLTATRKDDNHLDIYVAMKNDDGTTSEELFAFKKK